MRRISEHLAKVYKSKDQGRSNVYNLYRRLDSIQKAEKVPQKKNSIIAKFKTTS